MERVRLRYTLNENVTYQGWADIKFLKGGIDAR
jgi:hypothetical protein